MQNLRTRYDPTRKWMWVLHHCLQRFLFPPLQTMMQAWNFWTEKETRDCQSGYRASFNTMRQEFALVCFTKLYPMPIWLNTGSLTSTVLNVLNKNVISLLFTILNRTAVVLAQDEHTHSHQRSYCYPSSHSNTKKQQVDCSRCFKGSWS